MEDVRKLITEKIHFIGKSKYKVKQTPNEEKLLKEIDRSIDAIIKELAKETGEPIKISDGDRYWLRWEFIKAMLSEMGVSLEELNAIEEDAISATEEAVKDREKYIDSFKVIK